MLDGLIIKGIGGFYYVKSGKDLFECKPRGVFRKERIQPAAGDVVEISILDELKKIGVIEKIHKRKNCLIRPQVANVDQVILIFAAKHPEPDMLLLDKLLIRILSLNIIPVICVNKIDLASDDKSLEQFETYRNEGFTLIEISASNDIGVENLKKTLSSGLSILAGPSGVGKSTLVSKLHPVGEIEIGSLSDKIERGKHTTRHVELFKISDEGYLADTPGFSSFNIDEIASQDLKNFYPKFVELKSECRFLGCNHMSEPDCAIKEAVESGEIDGGRYERYRQIFEYLKTNERNKY